MWRPAKWTIHCRISMSTRLNSLVCLTCPLLNYYLWHFRVMKFAIVLWTQGSLQVLGYLVKQSLFINDVVNTFLCVILPLYLFYLDLSHSVIQVDVQAAASWVRATLLFIFKDHRSIVLGRSASSFWEGARSLYALEFILVLAEPLLSILRT